MQGLLLEAQPPPPLLKMSCRFGEGGGANLPIFLHILNLESSLQL
jgi:hypothetical protein